MNDVSPAPDPAQAAIAAIRTSQPAWADRPIKDRLTVIRRLRHILAKDCQAWARTASRPNMTEADILVAEVLTTLSALRFLEAKAARLLAARAPMGRRPAWLFGTRLTVRRVPFGAILIIAPRNYPLFLPAVQAIQALAAGNGVMVKPAPGFGAPMHFLQDALTQAGLPDGLFATLPDSHAAGSQALLAGADKVVLTGGAGTGRRVLAQLANTLTPATMELSGDDAVIVLPGAPIDTVARAIGYGLMLNGGETCIAPRRIIAVGDAGPALIRALHPELMRLPERHVPAAEATRLRTAVETAVAKGNQVIGGPLGIEETSIRPLAVLANTADQCLPPLFGPAASAMSVPTTESAIALANASPFALGASVFGPHHDAQAVGRRLRAGCVVVNDIIVPTADPRLPFGGAGESGFGVTRGAEGLLEMTRPQAIVSRRRTIALQYRPLPPSSAAWIARMLRFMYGRH